MLLIFEDEEEIRLGNIQKDNRMYKMVEYCLRGFLIIFRLK